MPQSVVQRPGLAVAVALVALVFVNSAIVANPNASTNTLLNSGTLEAYANTPIYTSDGMVFTVGAVNADAFDLTTRLQTALNAAEQAGAVVKDGWSTETGFEEWRDRLILLKKTHFYMLDGNRFNTEFFTGEGFSSDKSVTVGEGPIPDVAALVQDFINAGGHLELYPEAQVAGAQGAAELIAELKQDRGPVTIIETIEFSRVVEPLAQLQTAKEIDILINEPEEGTALSLPDGASLKPFQPRAFDSGTNFQEHPSGVAAYSQEMLNGFTVGNEWSKSITYDRRWFYAKAIAFAGFGLGVRIPWTAEVEVSPKVVPANEPDRTPYDASISVRTLDADTDFYRRVGVSQSQRFDGKELPMQAGAGIGLEIEVLGYWYLNRGKDDPVVGKTINLSKDFDPPLGDPIIINTPPLLYEDSGLAYLAALAGVGGDFRVTFGINGDAIALEVSPHNSWNKNGSAYSSGKRTIQLTDENTPVSLSFAVDDSSALESQSSYHYGPIYDQASYETSLDITPEARIRGQIYLSQIWGVLSDITLTSSWHPLFTATFNLPSLGPHDGTDSKLQATHRNTRYLPRTLNSQPERIVDTFGDDLWNFQFINVGSDSSVMVEYIPEGFELSPGSVKGGGVYHAAERKIVWTLDAASIPETISYQISALTAGAVPRPVGAYEVAGELRRALGDSRYASEAETARALEQFELSLRPTLDEVRDLRPGATLLDVSDGSATLKLKVQQSDDLADWEDVSETTVELPADAPVRFFRYVPAAED